MHEWALAEAIIETLITKAFEINKKKFNYLKIVIGRLQQIDRDILVFVLDEMLKLVRDEHGLEVDQIVLEDEKTLAECRRCGYRWEIDIGSLEESVKESIHFIPDVVHTHSSCPRCDSHDFEIVSGRGISIDIG